MQDKTVKENKGSKPVLPDYYRPFDETDAAQIDAILAKYGPVKEMSLDEIRAMTKKRMKGRQMSDVIREMRDEGY